MLVAQALVLPLAVDMLSDLYYNKDMAQERKYKPNLSIRMEPQALRQARIAALIVGKTVGLWLEEAIQEKIERERGQTDVTEADS